MELSETPPAKLKPSKAISLQETSKRMRTTPAAKKREDMAEKMYTLLQKEQQSDLQNLEDEYELAFVSLARRANKYLKADDKEDLLQEVEEIVRRAINKARRKDTTPQPTANPTAMHQNYNNFASPPPLVNAASLQSTMTQQQQQQQEFFNAGQVTYDTQTGQHMYQM